MRHIISALDLDSTELVRLFQRTRDIKEGHRLRSLEGKIMVCLFYEPSTRTRFSFEIAMRRLGGAVVSTENAKEFSSEAKGENLRDSIRVISGYAPDVIVLRHDKAGSAREAADMSSASVINAGDGANEHPTQAFLDLFTIWEACEKGRFKDDALRVHFYGDNLHGRTVRSLARLLATHAKAIDVSIESVHFSAPENRGCGLPDSSFLGELSKSGLPIEEGSHSPDSTTHVLYLTRVQKERYPVGYFGPKSAFPEFGLKQAASMHPSAIIMHPLPRIDELSPDVDADPRAWYFRQAENGLYVRMALLEMLLAR